MLLTKKQHQFIAIAGTSHKPTLAKSGAVASHWAFGPLAKASTPLIGRI